MTMKSRLYDNSPTPTARLRPAVTIAALLLYASLLPIATSSLSGGAAPAAAAGQQCCDCHQEVCAETDHRLAHAPFKEQRCTLCHVKAASPPPPTAGKFPAPPSPVGKRLGTITFSCPWQWRSGN